MVIKSKQSISKVTKYFLRYVKQKIKKVKNSLKKKKNFHCLTSKVSIKKVWH